jgi:transcriptional regulator with XRE-family HTH domain
MRDDHTFGQVLHRLRRERDLTQEALGQAAFCSRDAIKKLENGQRRPSRQLAAQLADVLGLAGLERVAFLAAARASQASVDPVEPPPRNPLRSPTQRLSGTIPTAAPPFVGRTQELSDLIALLVDPQVRLVTVVAMGGMGKTRLALAALERLQSDERFPHGVAFAALDPLVSAEHLDTTLATAVGLPLTDGGVAVRTLRQQLLDYLREKRLLLDNCEHLLDGAAELASAILANAPGVTLLATSRERLELRAERRLPLDGMLTEDDGVTLFAATARAVQPSFAGAATS